MVRVLLFLLVVFSGGPAWAQTQDEYAKLEEELNRVNHEASATLFQSCVRGAAKALAITSSDAADLVAIAAMGQCSDDLREAGVAASRVYPQVSPEEHSELYRTEWTKKAIEIIVEARASR
jgi:hypothetical protein